MNTEVIDRPTVAEQTPSAIATSITTVQGEVAKFDQIAAGLAAIEAAHPKNVIVAAIDTPAGMRLAEASWRAYRNPRLEVEKARKAAKAPVLALGKAIDSFAADLEAKLLAGEEHYKAQITAEEARREAVKAEAARKEAERLAGLRQEVDVILAGWLDRCTTQGMTADRVAAGITALTAAAMPADRGFQDVAAHWGSAKLLTLGKMERIRLDLERAELQAQREEQARQDAERAAQQAAELKKARDEAARLTSLSRRISEIHAAATGHERASAWDLFEAITAVEALDVSESTYQEFAAAAQAAQASTLAALRAKHSAAMAREDERAKALQQVSQDADAQVQAACGIPAPLLQDASRGLFDALASKPDAMMHAREAAAAIAASQPEPTAPVADDNYSERHTLALCREALEMLAPEGDCSLWSDAHTAALRTAVDCFEATI
jgi:hypothetical protein